MNILIFCSNPVNGGTARIFFETISSMRRILSSEYNLIPCVNQDNPVEIYKKIEGLVRLPIWSAEEICKGKYGGELPKRIVNVLYRRKKYRKIEKQNIIVMEKYLKENNIKGVIIHNGGYVGDDLCNQMLHAAYCCAEQIQCRIFVLHSDMKKNRILKMRYFYYDKRLSKESTSLITVSNYTRNRILNSSFISKDISIIYNGLTITYNMSEEEKRNHIHIEPGNFEILMIGNFMNNKGQYDFIEMAGKLAEHNGKFKFSIIGNVYDIEYYEKCKKRIEILGLQQNFSIYCGINNAFEFINLYDVLVVPSLYDESFGLVSVEAMAAGRPVVAFACGGIPEVVIDGIDGFVVPIGDIIGMAEKILWLSSHPEERKLMGQRCRKDYEEKFSGKAMAHNYKRYINSVGLNESDISGDFILFKNKENCCGCSACYAICPVRAISMEPDEEGFLYPFVDRKKCIHCNQCINVCAFKSDQKENGFYLGDNEDLCIKKI